MSEPDALMGVPIVYTDEWPVGNTNEIILTDLPSRFSVSTGITLKELLDLLERCKREHYTDGNEGFQDCSSFYDRPCDCGADELNAKIAAMISRLTREELSND